MNRYNIGVKSNHFPALYHLQHQAITADLPLWEELAKKQGGPALELGSGTGRVVFHLAKSGFEVSGLENDLNRCKTMYRSNRFQEAEELLRSRLKETFLPELAVEYAGLLLKMGQRERFAEFMDHHTPEMLHSFREKRYQGSTYAKITTCSTELKQSDQIFLKYHIPVVFSDGRSIEETATQVAQELRNLQEAKK